MSRIQTIIRHAEKQCMAKGSRLTEKRKHVLHGLLSSQKALSAYELIDYCNRSFGEVLPAMSIYRILDFLQNEHLVHKLSLANKYVACAHITCDHDHGVAQFLICGQCQRVSETSISKSIIKTLKNNIKKAGFHLVSPQIEMNCLCERCANPTA